MSLTRIISTFIMIFLITLVFSQVSIQMVSAETVSVYVQSTRAGGTSSIGWVGSVNIKINEDPYIEYCIEWNQHIAIGKTYTATVIDANDILKWRSVNYILAWYALQPDPSDPTKLIPVDNNNEAYAIQVAIWKYTTNTWKPDDPPNSRALAIYNEALNKDVARPGDTLALTADDEGLPPGMPVEVTAKITPARQNVKILFSTDKGIFDDTSTTETTKLTDSNGEATAVVIGPEHTKVTAETRAHWSNILDLGDNQDLVAMGYKLKAEILIDTITIFVVPEIPLGTVSIIATCFSAYKIRKWKARKK